MVEVSEKLGKILEDPIEIDCYMVAISWWNQWIAFIKSNCQSNVEPGIIYNFDLV